MCINKNEELLPYYEKAKELLNYDPETGVFTWKEDRVGRGRPHKKGDVAGSINKSTGYRTIRISIDRSSKILRAHRLAWFIHYNELPNVIDHINHSRDDNRIKNLRSCTNQQNISNQQKRINNTSGYKGVHWYEARGRWVAQIQENGKQKHLGYFDCPKEASKAYEAKALELFGEYNILNKKEK